MLIAKKITVIAIYRKSSINFSLAQLQQTELISLKVPVPLKLVEPVG